MRTSWAEYANQPEPGIIAAKDDAEKWEVKTPRLQGADAQWDRVLEQ